MSKNAFVLTRDFGKADAKVLLFCQSTKFISKNFQKKVHFPHYFDPHQGKRPPKKEPFTQKSTFVQTFGAILSENGRKSLSVGRKKALFLCFGDRNYRSVARCECTFCGCVLHELESLQVLGAAELIMSASVTVIHDYP